MPKRITISVSDEVADILGSLPGTLSSNAAVAIDYGLMTRGLDASVAAHSLLKDSVEAFLHRAVLGTRPGDAVEVDGRWIGHLRLRTKHGAADVMVFAENGDALEEGLILAARDVDLFDDREFHVRALHIQDLRWLRDHTGAIVAAFVKHHEAEAEANQPLIQE